MDKQQGIPQNQEQKKGPNSNVKQKVKKKKGSSDRKAAYLLIAPALILILVISIWPVIQSVYFSMFDLKLNDPTKSETHLSYQFDLERYLNTYPFLVGAVENEMNKGNAKDEFPKVITELENIDKELQKNSNIKDQYDNINEKLNNFENVSSDQSVVQIDGDLADKVRKDMVDVQKDIKEIANNEKLAQEKQVVGLSNGLDDAVIKPNFIGFKHYQNDLSDMRMWKALGNTLTFTVLSVFIELVLGLAIALLINKAFIGRGIIRATILIPWAIPTAVSALMWKFLYDGQNGIVAKFFEQIGLVDSMSSLLTNGTGAMFSVIFTDVWKTTPYMALLLLAGLQTIPDSLYEAAAIDGATKWKQFTKVTLPLLKSSLLVALLFRTLDAFRVFDLIYVLTGGGPANSTETISLLAYKVMFSQTNFGDGSALSVIVFICVAIISMLYIKFLGKDLLN